MKKIILDFTPMHSPESIQNYLRVELGFSDYYGHNLDALYDELTSISEDTCIGIFDAAVTHEVAEYLKRIKKVFCDAEMENVHLLVIYGTLEENVTIRRMKR